MGAYFLLIFNTHIFFSVLESPFDNRHSSFSPTTFFEIAAYLTRPFDMDHTWTRCGNGMV